MLHRSISMRRTASWGSRDAFSDGHISRHADNPVVPQGRRILSATTKARRHKRAHPLVWSANYQAMHQQQPAEDGRRPSLSASDNDSSMFQRPVPSQEAARRMSAPEHPPGKTQLTLSSCAHSVCITLFSTGCTGLADTVITCGSSNFIIMGSTILSACISLSNCQFVFGARSPHVQLTAKRGTKLQSVSSCKAAAAACAEAWWSPQQAVGWQLTGTRGLT